MVAVAMFDTLAYSKKLQAAGVPSQVAEVQAFTLSEIIEDRLPTKDDVKELATKSELKEEIQTVREEIHNLESRIDKRFNELESRIDKRFNEFEGRVEKRFTELELRITKLEHRVDKLSYQLTVRLGTLMAAGIILLESMHKFIG